MLTEEDADLLRHPSDPFAAALRTADGVCSGWDPDVPLRLFVMREDDEAIAANTDRCAEDFRDSGAPVQVSTVPHATYEESAHLASNVSATGEIARWFSTEFRP